MFLAYKEHGRIICEIQQVHLLNPNYSTPSMVDETDDKYWIGVAQKEVEDHRKGNGPASPNGALEKNAQLITIIASLLDTISNNDVLHSLEIAQLQEIIIDEIRN